MSPCSTALLSAIDLPFCFSRRAPRRSVSSLGMIKKPIPQITKRRNYKIGAPVPKICGGERSRYSNHQAPGRLSRDHATDGVFNDQAGSGGLGKICSGQQVGFRIRFPAFNILPGDDRVEIFRQAKLFKGQLLDYPGGGGGKP